jgi:ribosome-associated toxin RatA of RatAB toxin-antitoxin module
VKEKATMAVIPAWQRLGLTAVAVAAAVLGCASAYTVDAPRYPQYPGERNQHTRLVCADPRHIFRLLTTEKHFRDLLPQGTEVSFQTRPPYRVGTIVKIEVHHKFYLEWHSRVEHIDAPCRIRLRFLDGFFEGGVEIWEIIPQADRARVLHTMITEPSGLWRRLAWIIIVRQRHDDMVEAVLDNLRRTAENGGPIGS